MVVDVMRRSSDKDTFTLGNGRSPESERMLQEAAPHGKRLILRVSLNKAITR